MSKTIIVEYFGKRFPRVVPLRAGGKINFHQDRTTLELDEYDALLLLKNNIRMTPEKFEFGIAGVIDENIEQFEKDEDNEPGDNEPSDDNKEGNNENKPKLKINKKLNKKLNRR